MFGIRRVIAWRDEGRKLSETSWENRCRLNADITPVKLFKKRTWRIG